MKLRHVKLIQEVISLLKALRRLTPTAHHHIDTDKGIGHQGLDPMNLISKELTVVMAMHELQYRVAATLQGNVEMRHERTAAAAELDKLVTKQVRLQRTDAVTADTLHIVKSLHQIKKLLTSGLSEISDVHTRQYNLLATLCRSPPGLLDQRGD